jgi:hypothetical protein
MPRRGTINATHHWFFSLVIECGYHRTSTALEENIISSTLFTMVHTLCSKGLARMPIVWTCHHNLASTMCSMSTISSCSSHHSLRKISRYIIQWTIYHIFSLLFSRTPFYTLGLTTLANNNMFPTLWATRAKHLGRPSGCLQQHCIVLSLTCWRKQGCFWI